MLRDADLADALTTLGQILQDRGEAHDVVVVGGGALLLLGCIQRPTKDLDAVARVEGERWIRAEPFPESLTRAVEDVAAALDLANDWLNPGPAALVDLGLPVGFEDRVVHRTRDPSPGFRDSLLMPVLAELGVEDADV